LLLEHGFIDRPVDFAEYIDPQPLAEAHRIRERRGSNAHLATAST
jgi:hypothetical protein